MSSTVQESRVAQYTEVCNQPWTIRPSPVPTFHEIYPIRSSWISLIGKILGISVGGIRTDIVRYIQFLAVSPLPMGIHLATSDLNQPRRHQAIKCRRDTWNWTQEGSAQCRALWLSIERLCGNKLHKDARIVSPFSPILEKPKSPASTVHPSMGSQALSMKSFGSLSSNSSRS